MLALPKRATIEANTLPEESYFDDVKSKQHPAPRRPSPDTIDPHYDDSESIRSAGRSRSVYDLGAAPIYRPEEARLRQSRRPRHRAHTKRKELPRELTFEEHQILEVVPPAFDIPDIELTGEERRVLEPTPAPSLDFILSDDDALYRPPTPRVSCSSKSSRNKKETNKNAYPLLRITKATSGKHIFDGQDEDKEYSLYLRSNDTHPHILQPCARSKWAELPIWLELDMHSVHKIRHCPGSPSLIISRAQTTTSPGHLLLQLDRPDAAEYIVGWAKDKVNALSKSELSKVFNTSWQKTLQYRTQTAQYEFEAEREPPRSEIHSNSKLKQPARSKLQLEPESLTDHKQQAKQKPEPLGDVTKKYTKDLHEPDQPREKLTQRMRTGEDNAEQSSPPIRASTRETRRTRRSSPGPSEPEPSFDRWTHRNPEWENLWKTPLTYPPVGRNRATVDLSDIARLDEGEFLNDNLITFYFRYLQEQLEKNKPQDFKRIHFFNTFFFEKLRQTKGRVNYEGVKSWTSRFDLFGLDYVAVPVNENMHWYLAIVCNVSKLIVPDGAMDIDGDSTDTITADEPAVTLVEDDGPRRRTRQQSTGAPESPSRSRSQAEAAAEPSPRKKGPKQPAPPNKLDPETPKIITLDSLGSSHAPTCKMLREYLMEEANDKKQSMLSVLPNGVTAKSRLPLQDNHCDCGIFLLAYMEKFLEDPEGMVRKLILREDIGWEVDPAKMRSNLRELILSLHDEQDQRQAKEKEARRAQRVAEKAASSPILPNKRREEASPEREAPSKKAKLSPPALLQESQLDKPSLTQQYAGRSSPVKQRAEPEKPKRPLAKMYQKERQERAPLPAREEPRIRYNKDLDIDPRGEMHRRRHLTDLRSLSPPPSADMNSSPPRLKRKEHGTDGMAVRSSPNSKRTKPRSDQPLTRGPLAAGREFQLRALRKVKSTSPEQPMPGSWPSPGGGGEVSIEDSIRKTNSPLAARALPKFKSPKRPVYRGIQKGPRR